MLLRTALITTGLLACLLLAGLSGSARADEKISSLRNETAAWLDNNYSDTDRDFAAKVRKQFETSIEKGEDFSFTFGPGVMKSGQPMLVHVFAGRFRQFPLSIGQAKQVLSGPNGINFSGGRRGYSIEPAVVNVKNATVNGAGNLDPNQAITGQATYELRGNVNGNLAIRLTHRIDGSTTQSFFYPKSALGQNGTIDFSFSALAGKDSDKAKPQAGPLVVFVDVCTIVEEEDPTVPGVKIPKVKVHSNSVPVLVDVAAASAPNTEPIQVPSLEGTKWKFPGTETTVQFLANGRILWNGQETNGSWQQMGNSVTINVNDFTLFELTVNGAEMNGTWKRLQGEEAGKKNPSGLRRVAD